MLLKKDHFIIIENWGDFISKKWQKFLVNVTAGQWNTIFWVWPQCQMQFSSYFSQFLPCLLSGKMMSNKRIFFLVINFFFEIHSSPKWFRICALVAYIFGLFTSLHYCDPISSIFATFFILANIIRLSPTFFDDAKLPTHLRVT